MIDFKSFTLAFQLRKSSAIYFSIEYQCSCIYLSCVAQPLRGVRSISVESYEVTRENVKVSILE